MNFLTEHLEPEVAVGLFWTGGAVFTSDRKHRFVLWRLWDSSKGVVAFVGLNPSIADAETEDPTVRRCIRYALEGGFGGMIMLNVYSIVSTDPAGIKAFNNNEPINQIFIDYWSRFAEITVCAWGANISKAASDEMIRENITRPHSLKLTRAGIPAHPLYLRADLRPVPIERGRE